MKKYMRAMTVGNIMKRVVPILKSHGIVRAGLFGSAARGELRRGSDIDLLIDTNGKLGLFKVIGLKQELEKRLERGVDLVEYRALKPALRKNVMRDLISLLG
ncbi:MAG TPA: nucleotidyltransferase family protein [Candidatus Peribacteraceae bacterium]|nr:nucleotidyltransferase family protein [Candidatus Peribacteraceae bacterium]